MSANTRRQKDPARAAAQQGPCAVYVLDAGLHQFKIGMSKHPEKRCEDLARQEKRPLRLIHERWFENRRDAFFVEQATLARINRCPWATEWPEDISVDEVWHALDHAALDLAEGRISETRGCGTRIEHGLIYPSSPDWPGPPTLMAKEDILLLYALQPHDRGRTMALGQMDLAKYTGLDWAATEEAAHRLVAAGYLYAVEAPDVPEMVEMLGLTIR